MRGTTVVVLMLAGMLSACAQQSQTPKAANQPPALGQFAQDKNGWYLASPPQRYYAADRSWTMGGPLVTSPMNRGETHGAYDVYSLTQADPSAPYSKWTPAARVDFASKQECEDYKASQLKQATSPQAITQDQRSMIENTFADQRLTRDYVDSERCVSGAEIPSS